MCGQKRKTQRYSTVRQRDGERRDNNKRDIIVAVLTCNTFKIIEKYKASLSDLHYFGISIQRFAQRSYYLFQ